MPATTLRFPLPLAALFLLASPAVTAAQELPQPTPQHELLQKDVGVWKGVMKLDIPDVGPQEMPIKETVRMLDNGLWSITEFESPPYRGHGQLGYDPVKKKFVGTWIDNMSTHLSVMEGDYDEQEKTLVMHFKGMDPGATTPVDMKSVTQYGGDSRRFTMYAKRAGEWTTSFEIVYERAKVAEKQTEKQAEKEGAK